MRTRRTSVLIAAVLACAAGCVHVGAEEVEPAPAAPEAEEHEPPVPVVVGYAGPATVADQVDAPLADPPPEHVRRRDPIFFHLGAGYGALGQVDLAPCRDHGLPRGYVRVHVTFRTDGRVARAALQSDVLPSPEALTCVGERLETADVPPFEGGDVTLSKSFFVD